MFEELALSLSTAIFFICTLVVSAVIPSPPGELPEAIETIEDSANTAVSVASTAPIDNFSLTGIWNNSGQSFEFTKEGKILFGNNTADYFFDGENIIIKVDVDGKERSHTFKVEFLSPRVMKIGDVVFYKTEQPPS